MHHGGTPRTKPRARQPRNTGRQPPRELAKTTEGATPMNTGTKAGTARRTSGTSDAPPSTSVRQAKRRRDRGDDGISWDKTNKCFVGTISLGYDTTGKRIPRTVRGSTKAKVKDRLDALHDEIKTGIRAPATSTPPPPAHDWLDPLPSHPSHTAH